MRTATLTIFLFFILMVPLSTQAQLLPPPVISQIITEEEARQFIEEYKVRFMKMDIDAYMAFLSKEAVENRVFPYADIREAYRRTIEASHSISYSVRILTIQTYPQRAFVAGRYEIIQSFKGTGGRRVLKGNIQWEIVREEGSLKTREVNYGRDY